MKHLGDLSKRLRVGNHKLNPFQTAQKFQTIDLTNSANRMPVQTFSYDLHLRQNQPSLRRRLVDRTHAHDLIALLHQSVQQSRHAVLELHRGDLLLQFLDRVATMILNDNDTTLLTLRQKQFMAIR